jgi:Fungal protein kinase
MMNEDDTIHSWSAFLIDLDLAIREQRQGSSGARGKTGTRAFMAIGELLDEKHSFMHGYESFFWVLFWICVHYDGTNKESRVVPEFEKWNYVDMEELAKLKKGTVAHEGDFIRTTKENFTPYYKILGPWVNRLRKTVFPSGGRWEKEDRGLPSRMKGVLHRAQNDPEVLAE